MDAKRCGCWGAFRIGNRESFWGWPGDDPMIYHELEERETQGAVSTEERITVQLGVAIEGKRDRKYQGASPARMLNRAWSEGRPSRSHSDQEDNSVAFFFQI